MNFHCISTVAMIAFATATFSQTLTSPNGELEAQVTLDAAGTPHYALDFNGASVIEPSAMGFTLKPNHSTTETLDLSTGFERIGTESTTIDERWAPVWGEEAEIRNHCNELVVH